VRALLNFGHTFGHAIEAGLGYGKWLHGEAVGAGMVAAARTSARLGRLDAHATDRVLKLVQAIGCPTEMPALGAKRYWELMSRDKKVADGKLTFILLKQIGDADIVRDLVFADVQPLLP
jgi:3-dehydroquinate synthetase